MKLVANNQPTLHFTGVEMELNLALSTQKITNVFSEYIRDLIFRLCY